MGDMNLGNKTWISGYSAKMKACIIAKTHFDRFEEENDPTLMNIYTRCMNLKEGKMKSYRRSTDKDFVHTHIKRKDDYCKVNAIMQFKNGKQELIVTDFHVHTSWPPQITCVDSAAKEMWENLRERHFDNDI